MATTGYDRLLSQYKEIAMIQSLEGTLNWDTETTMPFAAVENRTNQYRYLNDKKNSIWKSSELEINLAEALKLESLDKIERRNLEIINREFKIRKKMPSDLMSELIGQSKRTNEFWKKAKSNNDFMYVLPEMKKLFALNYQRAEVLAELLEMDDPYQALISTRDHGFTVNKISEIFNENRDFLVPLAKKCSEKYDDLNLEFLDRKITRSMKEQLAHEVAKFFKYDSGSDTHAHIGEVEHPLTITLGETDVRITVKYERWEKVLFSAAHEVGHGIHRWNNNPDWRGQPVNIYSFPSLGECNSRYTENKIARSKEFWEFFYPSFQEITKGKFADVPLDEFYLGINRVKAGTSRMKADEVTYGLHIIIRFEIERELFAEKIKISELPQVWNDKYEQYLGVRPSTDTEGVMQDLHWYNVYWGYFQGYALGDVMGSQIHHTMLDKFPGIPDSLRKGDYSRVYDYFVRNVYHKGGLYDPMDLLENVTGEKLTTKYLHNYLRDKYNLLYNL